MPCAGHAILFGRSIAAVLPGDLPAELALAVLDVCGAPALTLRVVGREQAAAGRSWPSSARRARAARCRPPRPAGPARAAVIGVVPQRGRGGGCWPRPALADEVVIADARDPVGVSAAVRAAGGPADVTVVCVDVPGCEGGAILATAPGGTVIFFSMATSFSAAALGAEGVAADVTMLVGNGYVPGHAELALDLIRAEPGVRALFARRSQGAGMTVTARPVTSRLSLDPAVVREARELARRAGQPIVDLARTHTTVSVERAVLRLAGLGGADGTACRG